MEGLKELVAASFARYGIVCAEGDSQFVWGRAPNVGTAALGCPAERSSAAASGHSNSGSSVAQAIRPAESTLTSALPEHNYKRSSQDICP